MIPIPTNGCWLPLFPAATLGIGWDGHTCLARNIVPSTKNCLFLKEGDVVRVSVGKFLPLLLMSIVALMVFAKTVGLYPRYFYLEWDEEVRLHDGRLIVVHLKRRYERLGKQFLPYSSVVRRDTEFGFNPDNKNYNVQLFRGFSPMFLGCYDNVWYMVLYGGYYSGSRNLPGQDWGELEGPYGQWAVMFEGGRWRPISMTRLPSVFQEPNMLLTYGEVEELLGFDGGVISLEDKRSWLKKHPLVYSDVKLTRPNL